MSETDLETFQGYLDGFEDDRATLPPSLSNRSLRYQHGWQNGRDDRMRKPRASAQRLRELYREATEKDRRQA